MTKTLDPLVEAATQAEVVRPFNLAYLAMEGNPIRVCGTPFNILWQGNLYIGIGDLGEVAAVEESGETRAFEIELKLSAVDESVVAQALLENYQYRECTLFLGFFNEDWQVIDDPMVIFSGHMQNMKVRAGQTNEITVNAVNEMSLWENSSSYRYNTQAHQARFPGDLGLEFIEQMKEKEILWPDRT